MRPLSASFRRPSACRRAPALQPASGSKLAQVCAADNFDVAIASNKARIYDAAANLEARGANVVAMEADLSTIEGVDRLYDAAQQFGRPVDVLIANAGIGLGNAFLDRDFQKKVRDVIDANITGTVYAIQKSPNSIAGWPSRALRGASGSRHQC